MYAVASPDPDPNPRGWGQLPNPGPYPRGGVNYLNLTYLPNEWKWWGGQPPPIPNILGEGSTT